MIENSTPSQESFGRYLSRERELRAMSREEVAAATRIGLPYLQALEEDRLDDLPGEAFAVGFIRNYARCIGLSADDALLRFHEQHPPLPKPAAPVPSRLRHLASPAAFTVGFAIGWWLSRH